METIILTGASKGIGAAILARLLEHQRYKVIVLGLNKPAVSPEHADRVEFHKVDLTNIDSLAQVTKSLTEGGNTNVYALINNAGHGIFKNIEELSLADWTEVNNINVVAPFLLTRFVLPGMKARNLGRIVNISSDAERKGFAGAAAYCASKHALRGLASATVEEVRGKNISVTNICPGRVDSFFNRKRPGDRPMSLAASDVASQVMHVLSQSERCNVLSIELNSTLE